MSDEARDLLVYGVAAANANDREEARYYLEWVLRIDADIDQETEAWYYLSKITDDEIGRTFEYLSLDAGRFRNRIEDILTQLFGHSWYHRGQIAMLVRAAGGEPAITDLVYWCREPVVT